ncbi:unnamed protein product [Pedinophyceae sp. YPF-701]|nr:unnamed protein product [Pedinophyceae sp. YPF-701]
MAEWTQTTKSTAGKLPQCATRAAPGDASWEQRLKEELAAMIQYIKMNKAKDEHWFTVDPPLENGAKWSGTCWMMHEYQRYEFRWQLELGISYPAAPPEIELPELEGKTAKMYRGGRICTTIHFDPLWRRNVPAFGLAHAFCLGLGPWMAAEVPYMAGLGLIQPVSGTSGS